MQAMTINSGTSDQMVVRSPDGSLEGGSNPLESTADSSPGAMVYLGQVMLIRRWQTAYYGESENAERLLKYLQ